MSLTESGLVKWLLCYRSVDEPREHAYYLCRASVESTPQDLAIAAGQRWAIEVGRRKSSSPVVLVIRAGEAADAGVLFYAGNEKVWLADHIPPQFIEE